MLVKDIVYLLEEFAPLSLQESYDNAGLICGSLSNHITSVLLTIDITEEVIDEAINENCNLIISHHPLFLKGLKNLRPDTYVQRCLIKAIRHNLNIYSAHTNIDAVVHGVSQRMADKLQLTNRAILQPSGKLYSLTFYTPTEACDKVRDAILEAGAGHIGNYSHCSYNSSGTGTFKALAGANPYVGELGHIHQEQEIKSEITVPAYLLERCIRILHEIHPYEEPVCNIIPIENPDPTTGFGIIGEIAEPVESISFLKNLKKIFQCQMIRHTSICKPYVKRIAVCGGSGSFLTQAARAKGADIYISADYKYHDFFQAENKLIIADIGHYESEQYTKEIFYELLVKKISNFAVRFSRVRTNPVYYL